MSYSGKILREKMLGTFGSMLRPARMIMNMTREELAEKSGLPLEIISGVEDGFHRFHEPHYLALASVFDYVKFTEDDSIYQALIRILTPDNEFEAENHADDFILVKRWLETFNLGSDGVNEAYEDEEYNEVEDYDECLDDTELANLTHNYKIFMDYSAIKDEDFQTIVNKLETLLRKADAVISVPASEVEKLRYEINICKDGNEEFNLSASLQYLTRKINEGLIKLRDSFGGDLNAELFAIAEENPILIITQDNVIAENLTSVHENISAARIEKSGSLIMWR